MHHDGGFLCLAGELERGQLKCNLVHLVGIDGAYDMVRLQEVSKYGRDSGVDFGRARIKRLGTARPSKCRGFDTVE